MGRDMQRLVPLLSMSGMVDTARFFCEVLGFEIVDRLPETLEMARGALSRRNLPGIRCIQGT